MKNILKTAILFMMFGVITISSCKKDKCENKSCPTGQTLVKSGDDCNCVPTDACATKVCNNGGGKVLSGGSCSCNCLPGFSGASCEIVDTTQVSIDASVVSGDYSANDEMSDGVEMQYATTVAISGGTGTISNIADGYFTNPINVTYSGHTITIPSQKPDSDQDYTISGTGVATLANGVVSISWAYTISEPNPLTGGTYDQDITGIWSDQ